MLLSMGCAGTHGIQAGEERPSVSASESASIESAPPKGDKTRMSTAVEDNPPPLGATGADPVTKPTPGADDGPKGARPVPSEVEGDVFAHCAYGPPNYGEDPATDAKEDLSVLVLDKPLPEICPEPGADCAQHVRMFHVATLSESGVPYPKSLVGKRVRFKISKFEMAVTGHHHSRIMLWYDDVEDLGPATHKSLRAVWSSVKDDFLGISCKGYPR